jgi:dTMP kinase
MLEIAEKQLKRGFIIAFEGIDGAGKTTQSVCLLENLKRNGYPATRFHEPTNSIWGKRIRDLATNGRHKVDARTEFEYFYQDRIHDVGDNIRPAYDRKSIILMDRYYFSNIAYQSARGLDPSFIEHKNEEIAPKADLLIILDLDPKVALKRIRDKRNDTPNHFEREKYLEEVRKIFLQQFKDRPNVIIVEGNGSRSAQTICDEIWLRIEPILKKEVVS